MSIIRQTRERKPDAPTHYLLDISRLLVRAKFSAPTGIDRVELAYASYLLEHCPERTAFCAMHPIGVCGGIRDDLARSFVQALVRKWDDCATDVAVLPLLRRIRRELFFRALPKAPNQVYLLLSHHHLTRPGVIRRALRQTGARLVLMIHDVIPLSFPEYARPGETERHHLRMRTAVAMADGMIVPTQAVHDSIEHLLYRAHRDIPVWVVPHGVHISRESGENVAPFLLSRPYFACLNTIEPRKNHLLLLHVWRDLVETMGDDAPTLVLVGKRGWENENILDLLERSPALAEHVVEYNHLSDRDVIRVLKGSRALLFPSFVEGYGLPVVEALTLGVPAICSDIPVLREIAQDVPDYLDPLDGVGWRALILQYLSDDGARAAQMARLHHWTPRSWNESIALALTSIDTMP